MRKWHIPAQSYIRRRRNVKPTPGTNIAEWEYFVTELAVTYDESDAHRVGETVYINLPKSALPWVQIHIPGGLYEVA